MYIVIAFDARTCKEVCRVTFNTEQEADHNASKWEMRGYRIEIRYA